MRIVPVSGQPGLYRRQGLRGLGMAQAALMERLRIAQTSYDQMKQAAQPFLRVPFSAASFETLAQQVVSLSAAEASSTLVQLSGQQIGLLVRGTVGEVGRSFAFVQAVATSSLATDAQRARAANVLTNIETAIAALSTLLSAAQTAQDAIAAGRRVVGLSDFGVSEAAMLVVVVAGAALGLYLVIRMLVTLKNLQTAERLAREACERDAAAGRPCTGEDYVDFYTRSAREASEWGMLPDLAPILRSTGDALFWGVAILAVGLVAYGVWVTKPAADRVRASL